MTIDTPIHDIKRKTVGNGKLEILLVVVRLYTIKYK